MVETQSISYPDAELTVRSMVRALKSRHRSHCTAPIRLPRLPSSRVSLLRQGRLEQSLQFLDTTSAHRLTITPFTSAISQASSPPLRRIRSPPLCPRAPTLLPSR